MEHTVIPERVLSIRQPWATLILEGFKDVENRSWWTPWRGRFIVHSGKQVDPFAEAITERLGLDLAALPTGAYLGAVDLVDVHMSADKPGQCCLWGEAGQYHWRLQKPELFRDPIPGAGRLSLYPTPDDVRAILEEQQRA